MRELVDDGLLEGHFALALLQLLVLGGDRRPRVDEGLTQLLRIKVVELVGDHGS